VLKSDASVPKISPRPCGDQGHSLPSPGPPASLFSVQMQNGWIAPVTRTCL
jgi:hypothetical protein